MEVGGLRVEAPVMKPEFPCPECGQDGMRAGGYTETLLGWFHDDAHNHNPNCRVGRWACQECGHKWTGVSEAPCPAKDCDYGGPKQCCGAGPDGVIPSLE